MAEQEELMKELIKGKIDWSNLPPDIVYLIAKKLPNLYDYVSVHVTCKTWRYSTPLSDYPLCFPWLLEFHQDPNDPVSAPTTSLRLYSISSDETLTFPVKECRWLRGTSHNYIPLYDDFTGTICLFNPLNSHKFALPPLNNPCRVQRWMASTGTGPIHDRKISIVDLGGDDFNGNSRWAIYDSHHGDWSKESQFCYSFCCCHGKLFLSTHASSVTKVFDDSSKKLLYTIEPPHEEKGSSIFDNRFFYELWWSRRSYIVESCGEILNIFCYYESDIFHKSAFHIYQLKFDVDGQAYWAKISNIGNQVLFLEVRNGFSMTATPDNGLRGGQIYFIHQYEGKPYVYDVVARKVEAVPCPFNKCTWFVPSLC